MLTANGGLMESNEDTSQTTRQRKHVNHDNDNKRDACQDAYRKAMQAMEELAQMKG